MSTMRAYTHEFRESAVGLVLSEDLSIRKATDAEARVRELEAEVRKLMLERDIVKKAVAYFAREQP